MKQITPLLLALLISACTTVPEGKQGTTPVTAAWLYPETAKFQRTLADAHIRGLVLTDYHIHIRGGMTVAKAAERQMFSGIRSTVLENYGREWPLNDNATLAAFIERARSIRMARQTLPVGIQVNDRDWHTRIDPALLKELDFVLADTMIMGTNSAGEPQRLWLADYTVADPEAWIAEYLAHNLRILDEPISILANPTYLPKCLADQYDQLWTEARMRQLIAKAVEKGVALEIQAGSCFPKPAFLQLAKSMGAKFTFGTNNHNDITKDLDTWFEAIRLLDLRPADLAKPQNRTKCR